MDTYSRDVRGSKRSFEDISQSTIISQPINRREPQSTNSSREEERISSRFIERQVSSHSQNDPIPRVIQEMAEQAQPQSSHRYDQLPSQNVIDLTNEVEHVATRRRIPEVHRQNQGPQPLGSSSTISMGNIVDLTNDQEQTEGDEVIITGQRTVFLRQNIPRAGPRQPLHHNSQRTLRSSSPSLFLPSASVLPVMPSRYRLSTVRGNDGRLAVDLTSFGQMFSPHGMDNIPTFWHLSTFHSIPSHAGYGNHSFDRTPDHVPPPVARDNFTRSPTESDILVCPSCEEELAHNKEDPMIKKGNKAPSKKDREEHPFWVVKECGHVFCNKCFQNRGDRVRTTGFREALKPSGTKSTTRKYLVCAVDDCKSDVKGKDKWVGVFL